ncbi:VOC family protein [Nakamurella leprariae]|uniref:VOC family protein n=1 Tax=Nakamurella leprariae TaxID=2803911 RepID=A0A939BYS9_9ACTN|nr:VOC family protein [Nakamurella leprariae]MBM9466946.1 VOC family protein [Nakamurella leprariae]
METRISLVTLGVRDLDQSEAFYQELGWVGQRTQETVFVQAGPLALVLWDRAKLAQDSGVADPTAGDRVFGGFTLAQNVRSRDEVDAILIAAAAAGGTIAKPAQQTFYGGYAGIFLDPDATTWEIAFNPGFALAEDGALVLPDFGTGS